MRASGEIESSLPAAYVSIVEVSRPLIYGSCAPTEGGKQEDCCQHEPKKFEFHTILFVKCRIPSNIQPVRGWSADLRCTHRISRRGVHGCSSCLYAISPALRLIYIKLKYMYFVFMTICGLKQISYMRRIINQLGYFHPLYINDF